MRSTLRSALVALVTVCAVGAVASASALASTQPQMETGGIWPVGYTASSGEVTLQTTDITVHCSASKNSGEVVNKNGFANVHVTYTGCIAGGWGVCKSKGAVAGEIVTNSLTANLVYINKATKEVGQLFKPQTAGGAIAEYECGLRVKLTGGVIAKLPNEQVNKIRSSFTWDYRQKTEIQEPSEYEEGTTKISSYLTSNIEPYGLKLRTGEEATETMTFTTAVEISA